MSETNKLTKILNIITVVLVAAGTVIMIFSKADAASFTAKGLSNLKFYTVLSNEFAGIVAVLQLIKYSKKGGYLTCLKLVSTTAVTLTFLVVALFFGPLYGPSYGWVKLYGGSNFFFHLAVPLLCIAEFLTAKDVSKVTFKNCLIATLSTVVYGFAYLINILVNGVGEWPDTNDWYAFLTWGMGVGLAIFAGIVITNFLVALLLRAIINKIHKGAVNDV